MEALSRLAELSACLPRDLPIGFRARHSWGGSPHHLGYAPRCSWTAVPRSLRHQPCWLGFLGVAVQQHLGLPKVGGTTGLVGHWSRRNPLAVTLRGLSRVCFQVQLNAMLPAAGTYHFPWEINSALISEGTTLRTFGRLCSYNTISSEAILTAQHASVQHQIRVCTKFVEPFQAHLGSLYIVLGETDYGESEEVVIKARVFSCVEGINLQLLQKAIEEQRKYFHERKNHLEANPS